MTKLSDLSESYREAAARLRLGIEERQGRAAAGDRAAAREVCLLRQMLQEMRALRQLTAGYYTRPRDGYYTTSTLRAPHVDMSKQ